MPISRASFGLVTQFLDFTAPPKKAVTASRLHLERQVVHRFGAAVQEASRCASYVLHLSHFVSSPVIPL